MVPSSTGKPYITVPVDVEGSGLWQFVIDTGTTGVLVTCVLRDELGMSPSAGLPARGLDHQGLTLRQKIRLPTLRLGPHELDVGYGYVTQLAGPDRDTPGSPHNIGGVLGLRILAAFDVEVAPGPPHTPPSPRGTTLSTPAASFKPPAARPVRGQAGVPAGDWSPIVSSALGSRDGLAGLGGAISDGPFIAFHPVGHADQGVISTQGLVRVGCTGPRAGTLELATLQVSLNGGPPMPGILDLGAVFSTMNSAAAQAAQAAGGGAPLHTTQVASRDGSVSSVIRGGVRVQLLARDDGPGYAPAITPPLLVRDVPVLGLMGLQNRPAMIVGRDLVCRSQLVLSLATESLWVGAPSA